MYDKLFLSTKDNRFSIPHTHGHHCQVLTEELHLYGDYRGLKTHTTRAQDPFDVTSNLYDIIETRAGLTRISFNFDLDIFCGRRRRLSGL